MRLKAIRDNETSDDKNSGNLRNINLRTSTPFLVGAVEEKCPTLTWVVFLDA